MECLKRGVPVGLVFQSLAGSQKAMESFGVSVEMIDEAYALAKKYCWTFTPADLIPAVEIAVSRHEELQSLENEIADLQERFETRKRVDRAKGLLMEKMGQTEPEAFRWLQKTSMNRRLTMREVADAVIEQVSGGKE